MRAGKQERRQRQLRMLKKIGRRTIGFTWYFTAISMALIFVSVSVALFISELLNKYLDRTVGFTTPWFQVLFSLVIAFGLTVLIGWLIVRPIRRLQEAMDAVAEGDFSVSVPNGSRIREIESINRSFDVMVKELKATEILQSDFVSNVSHEFKTPLNAIEGYAMLLEDETITSEERAQYLERIRLSTQRMSTLVGNILLLSKLDTQAIDGQKKRYRLDEQLRQAIVALEPKWSEKGTEFDVSLDEVHYYGNEGILLHVWINLFENAIKFSPPLGLVRISLTCADGEIVCVIEDSGPGIDEKAKKHIYDKFYQSDTSHKEEGNGLGLALVKKVLDLAGGRISAENRAEGGCRFTVSLPEESI